MRKIFTYSLPLVLLAACGNGEQPFDASGTFEADEVIVSSEMPGKILHLALDEGSILAKDSIVGAIDALPVQLQQEQVEASIRSLKEKTYDAAPQVTLLQEQLRVQEAQLNNLLHEKKRIENLLKADAATGKQLDDLLNQIEVMQKQMNVTRQQIKVQLSNTGTQNRSILSESAPLEKKMAQLKDQEKRTLIVNPVAGTVLTQYAEAGEITAAGKALYKIADLSNLTLRAYITGEQLPSVQLNQSVTVYTDEGKKAYKAHPGILYWIADKAEFTPKTIQTKEERANLVYAVKIRVPNDGLLKIGMYGEVKLKP